MAQNTDAIELPEVESVTNDPVMDPVVTTIHFENGAKLRYKQTDEGIVEDVFAPSDPDSVMESNVVTQHAATVSEVADNSLEMYAYYDTVAELSKDWESLAEWICHE